MPGFFQRLAARTLGAGPPLAQPVVPSLFANGGTWGQSTVLVSDQTGGEARQAPDPAAVAERPFSEACAPLVKSPRSDISRGAPSLDFDQPVLAPPLPESPRAPISQALLVPIAPVALNANVAKADPRIATPETRFEAGNRWGMQARRDPDAAVPHAPSIRVTIGRIEVRAEFPAAAPVRTARSSPSPSLSLEQYQRQRDGGLR
jgi:hypothetical protein